MSELTQPATEKKRGTFLRDGILAFIGLSILACIISILNAFIYSALIPTPSSTTDSPREVENLYRNNIMPILQKLEEEDYLSGCKLNLPPKVKYQIILIPLEKRLYYIQENLFPNLVFGNPEASTKIYVAYNYTRGIDLSIKFVDAYSIRYDPTAFSRGRPDTQELLIKLYVLVETEKGICIAERQLSSAQINHIYSGDTRHRDMVDDALSLPRKLNPYTVAINSTLKGILCYATGIDFHPEIDLSRRLSLIESALQSPYWSDREQAARTLGYKEENAQSSLPLLTQIAQKDENSEVRLAASWAIKSIRGDSE